MPTVDRPLMPEGYGVDQATTYLSWEHVEHRLRGATNYWLATTGPDGGPHVVPRWGVWLEGRFWYDGSPETKHVRNLEENPQCALHLEDGSAAVIVYGASQRSLPVRGDLGEKLSLAFGEKYSPEYEPGPESWSDEIAGGLRVLVPVTVIAWSSFPVDMTRFRFEPVPT